MKPKDTILAAFRMEPVDQVPATVFGAGMWTFRNTGHDFKSLIGKPKEMAQSYIESQRMTGAPIVYVGSGYNNFHAAALGGRIKFRQIGAPDLEEPLIRETADELDDLDVEKLAEDELVQTVWEAARLVAEEIGDQVVVTATAWGPFTLAGQILGVERLMRSMYKWPGDATKAIDFAGRVILRFYEPLLAHRLIPMVSLADPTASGDLVSANHFRRFALPPLQQVTAEIRAQGAYTLLHICGDTTDKLDMLVQTGADCVSIDHKVDIGKAKQVFAMRACLAGNVNPVHVLNSGTPADVEAASRACLDAAAPGGGFVLMPGCDIPPTVPLENILTFHRTAATWRQGATA